MPDDEYSHVSRGKLKLKTDGEIKKKKKKKKDKEKLKEKLQTAAIEDVTAAGNPSGTTQRVLTKAELSFKQMQEKTQNKRILEKASMTHKERVEKFNQHLDSLTEHFDIPKVSWTK
ncbi:protein FAM32A-like [Phlebotomus papatasi]|uniref:protein FAM32A-like n=1 Tax=Phlebotomus papatasi TaxID=29031 RepID=UPI002483F238|nr:protein FAM32A-like [Phlebotomus papatasi]